MSWECPECGEINKSSWVKCVCGYVDKEVEGNDSDQTRKKPESKRSGAGFAAIIAFGRVIAVIMFTSWLTFITKQTVGRPYFLARVFTTTSFSISMFCIYPLSKIVGGKSVILAPARLARDTLFDIGWNLFPEDDADRELQWFFVKYLFNPISNDMRAYVFNTPGKRTYTTAEYQQYMNAIDRHLEPLATLPMKDRKGRKLRYQTYFRAAKEYYLLQGGFLQRKCGTYYYREECGKEYMQKIRYHFNLFLRVRERTRIETPGVYKDFASFRDDFWYILHVYLIEITADLIYNDIQNGNLICDGILVKEFLQTRENILNKLPEEKSVPLQRKMNTYKQIFDSKRFPSAIFDLIKKECKDPEIQKYKKYPPGKYIIPEGRTGKTGGKR